METWLSFAGGVILLLLGAAINTLEQLTLTTTPGQAVPLQFEFHTWRVSGSGNAYFSDMTASQT